MSQDVGMGWDGKRIADAQVLILTTMGGLRQERSHWHLGIIQVTGSLGFVKEAAKTFRK